MIQFLLDCRSRQRRQRERREEAEEKASRTDEGKASYARIIDVQSASDPAVLRLTKHKRAQDLILTLSHSYTQTLTLALTPRTHHTLTD